MKRTLLWVVYAAYLVVVAYLVWNPQPTVPSDMVYRVTDLLDAMGFTARADFVEFGLNVLLFVPMSLIGVFVFRRLRIADWVLLAFCASFVIELAQKFFLPARSADARDVVSNTLGALIGALIARPILLWDERRRGAAPSVVAEGAAGAHLETSAPKSEVP